MTTISGMMTGEKDDRNEDKDSKDRNGIREVADTNSNVTDDHDGQWCYTKKGELHNYKIGYDGDSFPIELLHLSHLCTSSNEPNYT